MSHQRQKDIGKNPNPRKVTKMMRETNQVRKVEAQRPPIGKQQRKMRMTVKMMHLKVLNGERQHPNRKKRSGIRRRKAMSKEKEGLRIKLVKRIGKRRKED